MCSKETRNYKKKNGGMGLMLLIKHELSELNSLLSTCEPKLCQHVFSVMRIMLITNNKRKKERDSMNHHMHTEHACALGTPYIQIHTNDTKCKQ